jgi:Xaa-Pro aminopeptidase
MKIRRNQPFILPSVSNEEMRKRHQRAKEIMEKNGMACLIVAGSQVNYGSGSHYIRYLTHYGIYYGEGYLVFPLKGEPVLFCRSKNQEYNASQISAVATRVSSYPTFAKDVADYVKDLKLQDEKIGIVGVELMPAYVFLDLCQHLARAKFVFVSNLFLDARLINHQEELDFFRKAGETADEAYRAIQETARPGVWEYEVSAAVEKAYLSKGASFPSFMLLSSGPSPSFPACAGSHRRLEEGDTILNELTPCYGGYWIQWGRPFVIGKPTQAMGDLFKITLEVYHLAEQELRPGKTFGQVVKKLHAFIEGHGCTWLAGAIQFIGLDPTEQAFFVSGEGFSVKPVPRPIDEKPLSPGMVVVIQPNVVAKDLSRGMLLIDTCIITDGAPEILSHSPLEYTTL